VLGRLEGVAAEIYMRCKTRTECSFRGYVAAISVLLSVLVSAPLIANAETWADVQGGSFVVSTEVLTSIKGTLEAHVEAAATAQGQTLPPWSRFLLQYRGKRIQGHKAIEIHGSCDSGNSVDVHQDFLDERITDGGSCYSLTFYSLDTGRYSNVVLHGYA
jgi:hypothetical protein